MENWKIIKEFPNYEVSNFGRVRNKEKKHILKAYKNSKGYLRVKLTKENQLYQKFVHRLVMKTFNPDGDFRKTVNHIDLNKTNNDFTNLELMTIQENINHYHQTIKKELNL